MTIWIYSYVIYWFTFQFIYNFPFYFTLLLAFEYKQMWKGFFVVVV